MTFEDISYEETEFNNHKQQESTAHQINKKKITHIINYSNISLTQKYSNN